MTIIKRLLAICFFGFLSLQINAQYNDFGVWSSLSIKQKLNANWKYGADLQWRANENSTAIKTFFVDLDLRYSFSKHVKGFISYRLGKKRQIANYYLAAQRFSSGLTAKSTLKKWKLGYRFKIQKSMNDLEALDRGAQGNIVFRNKFSVEHKLMKKTSMWSSFEVFSFKNEKFSFSNTDWRWKTGIDRKLKKRQYLTLGFMIQRELYNYNPVTDYVVLLGYQYELKKRKTKEKASLEPTP